MGEYSNNDCYRISMGPLGCFEMHVPRCCTGSMESCSSLRIPYLLSQYGQKALMTTTMSDTSLASFSVSNAMSPQKCAR